MVSAYSVQNPALCAAGNVYGMYLAPWFSDMRSLAHTQHSTGEWKEQTSLLDEKASTAILKTICKHVCFSIYTVIVTGCLIFLLWVHMEADYKFICGESTLWSTHRGFVCLRYLDTCHKNAHGAWSGVQELETADFQI